MLDTKIDICTRNGTAIICRTQRGKRPGRNSNFSKNGPAMLNAKINACTRNGTAIIGRNLEISGPAAIAGLAE